MEAKNRRKKTNFRAKHNKLASSAMAAWLIYLIIRIPIANIIGDGGNSFLSAVFEIYFLLLCLVVVPMPGIVARMTGVRMGRGQAKAAGRVFRVAMLFAVAAGLILGGAMFLGADFWAGRVMGEPMSLLAFRVLSPVVCAAFVGSVFCGYFQGIGTVMPSSFSRLLERVIMAAGSLLAATLLGRYGEKVGKLLHNDSFQAAYGTIGCAIGMAAGVGFSLLFLLVVFGMYRLQLKRQAEKDVTSEKEAYGALFRSLMLSLLPLALTAGLFQLRHVVDQAVYSHMLSASVGSHLNYGIYYGKYRVLTEIPLALVGMTAVTIAPLLSAMLGKADGRAVKDRIGESFRITAVKVMPFATALSFLALPVVRMLYQGDFKVAGKMLQVGTLNIFLFAWAAVGAGVLHGIHKEKALLLNMAVSMAVHVACLVVFIGNLKLDIYGVIYANIIMAFVLCLMNQIVIARTVSYRQEWIKTLVMPLAVALITGGIQLGIYKLLEKPLGNVPAVLIAFIFGFLLYFAAVILLRGLSERELSEMTGGRVMVRIAKTLHILP